MIIPKLSLNGTSAADLISARIDVREALLTTMRAMHLMEPHGRDYQHKGGEAEYKAAAATHRERMNALAELHTELGNEAMAIEAQQNR